MTSEARPDDYEALIDKVLAAGSNPTSRKMFDGPAAASVLRDHVEAKLAEVRAERCSTCDGTGDVHRADGEWLGVCDCPEGRVLRAEMALADRDRTLAEQAAVIEKLRTLVRGAIDLAEGLHETHDYLGTGSDSKVADKEYAADARQIAGFRTALQETANGK
jgi:hypothetical protein